MRNRMKMGLAVVALILLGDPIAWAVNLEWTSKTCVVVDGTFHVCKPTPDWDTQTKDVRDEAVRWVLHRQGANPMIRLIYDANATGKTAHDYGERVKKDLELSGLRVGKVEKRTINGRNVTLINASDPENEGKLNYLVAVYRDQAKGLRLTCSAGKDDFSFFSNEFMQSINSVHFNR